MILESNPISIKSSLTNIDEGIKKLIFIPNTN